MARQVKYEDKTIVEVLEFLKNAKIMFKETTHQIVVTSDKEIHDKVFREIVAILKNTRYGIQEDMKTYEILIFNSSL